MLNIQTLSQHMPGVIFWRKDTQGVYQEINQDCANLFGFKKKNAISGFTDYEIPCGLSDFADIFQKHDQLVMKKNLPLKLLEVHPCANNQWRIMIVTKCPTYNIAENISGTFASCIDITTTFCKLNCFLSKDSSFTLSHQKNYIIGQEHVPIKLTRRQSECLFFFLRRKTAKEIARRLKISHRTVEDYLQQIKLKFCCQTNSELFDIASEQGFSTIVPETLLCHLSEILSDRKQ